MLKYFIDAQFYICWIVQQSESPVQPQRFVNAWFKSPQSLIDARKGVYKVFMQTGAPPFSNQAALEMIEEELKQPVDQVFSFLSEDPIASASLGQVYFGVLAASGTEVAVKVW